MYFSPIFCSTFAMPMKNPVGTATMKYSRLSSPSFFRNSTSSPSAQTGEVKAMRMVAE